MLQTVLIEKMKMGWATSYIAKLKNGETVQFRPRGGSMAGRINSGQLVTVEPVTLASVNQNDIVLCSVNGNQFLHIVKAKGSDGRLLIGNNRGGTNGWTHAVFGRVTTIV